MLNGSHRRIRQNARSNEIKATSCNRRQPTAGAIAAAVSTELFERDDRLRLIRVNTEPLARRPGGPGPRPTAQPAWIRITEPAVSCDHLLTAHFEASHAAVPGHVMADIGDRAPGGLIGLARAHILQCSCRNDGYNEGIRMVASPHNVPRQLASL
jgi:hypothetical protein